MTTPKGRVEVICGCMFAGKTSELINRAQRAKIAGCKIQAFKPSIDNRYTENTICSHNTVELEATPVEPSNEKLNDILNLVEDDTDIVVIDEANLFEDKLQEVVKSLSEQEYRVIISGLDQDFRGEPFRPLPYLLAIADNVEKRTAICEVCGKPATKTQKLINGEPAPYDSSVIDVGACEKYEARCKECHDVK